MKMMLRLALVSFLALSLTFGWGPREMLRAQDGGAENDKDSKAENEKHDGDDEEKENGMLLLATPGFQHPYSAILEAESLTAVTSVAVDGEGVIFDLLADELVRFEVPPRLAEGKHVVRVEGNVSVTKKFTVERDVSYNLEKSINRAIRMVGKLEKAGLVKEEPAESINGSLRSARQLFARKRFTDAFALLEGLHSTIINSSTVDIEARTLIALFDYATRAMVVAFSRQTQEDQDKRPTVAIRGVVALKDPTERKSILEIQFGIEFGKGITTAIKKLFASDPKPHAPVNPNLTELFTDLNEGEVTILYAHGSGDNFILPGGATKTAKDVEDVNKKLDKVTVFVCMACFSGEEGLLGKAFAKKGAKVVITPTALADDLSMSEFIKQFLKRIVAGESIQDAFNHAAEATTVSKEGKDVQPFWDPQGKKPKKIRFDTAEGVDPAKPIDLKTGQQPKGQKR